MKRETLDTALAAAGIVPIRPADREAIERTAEFLTTSADRLSDWLKEVDK